MVTSERFMASIPSLCIGLSAIYECREVGINLTGGINSYFFWLSASAV